MVERTSHWEFKINTTKTTGYDKKVSCRFGVINKCAFIEHRDWMAAGWTKWQRSAPFARDFFLCSPGGGSECLPKELGYIEYAARMRALLASLGMDNQAGPLGGDAAMAFTPHSFRAFLPSVHCALGYERGELEWLSAWSPKQAATYVRTGKATTLKIQQNLSERLRMPTGSVDEMGEADFLNGIAESLRHRRVRADEIARVTSLLQHFTVDQKKAGASETEAENLASQRSDSAPSDKEDDECVPSEGYVISISNKRKIRCFHLIGGCYRRPREHYRNFVVCGGVVPPAADYIQVCRACWPTGRDVEVESEQPDSDNSEATESSSSEGSSDARDSCNRDAKAVLCMLHVSRLKNCWQW